MTVTDAQQDFRRAYVGGGPGVFVSGTVWIVAALVESSRGTATAFAVLFVGGMLIFPLGTALCRFLFGREKESADNRLGRVALESTFAMLGGLFAAWLFLRFEPDYVFPLAAIAVGTHYAAFRTLYGDGLFWVLGALITGVGVLAIYPVAPLPVGPIFLVGAIELLFAAVLTMRAMREASPPGA
jgi:hypothetical protein